MVSRERRVHETAAGVASGVVARAVVTPLDVVKIRMQLQVNVAGEEPRYRGLLHCLARTRRNWKGCVVRIL